MTTRCKFTCTGVTKRTHWDRSKAGFIYDAAFQPVTSGSEENKKFFASTPGGEIKLSTLREDTFIPGKDYYLDFTPADPAGV